MTHKEAIIEAMEWLGAQPDTIFIGQTVGVPGSYMYGSLKKVPLEKRVELPVAEEMQMGMTLGLAMQGLRVVSIFPRIDFMILGMNQLVNHIDKVYDMSEGRAQLGSIIIRTSIGPKTPLDGGVQHTQDHAGAVLLMAKHCPVVEVDKGWQPDWIRTCYKAAYYVPMVPATIFVEKGDLYGG